MRLQLTSTLALLLVSVSPASAQSRPWRLSIDALGYTDTDRVQAVAPSIAVRRSLDTDGSRLGARVALDVVSAASVDVVSHATRGFTEPRTEGVLDAAGAFGDHLLSLSYRFSWEPDYLSNGLTAGWRARLGTPDSVLDITYGLTWDVVGRVGTPWSAFSENLFSHSATAALTQNLGAETVLRVIYSLNAQDGFLEKAYRYVPLFLDGFDPSGVDASNVDAQRLAQRPPERVPDRRVGHALGARLVQYLEPIDGSLRIDYQIYIDDWLVNSHVIEAMVRATVTPGLRLGVYARGYFQNSAFFWQRAYVLPASGELPEWRSLDRELSSHQSVTGGLRGEWQVDDVSGYVDAAAMYTHWDEFLFLRERLALIGQVGFRWTTD